MTRAFTGIFLCLLLIISCKKDTITPATGWDDDKILDKRYDSVCFLMTHNAFNCPPIHLIPNQSFTLTRQMNDGVRGLMIDVYDGSPDPLVYHALPLLGQEKLTDNLLEIKNFLHSHPHAIITIIFENHCTNDALQGAIESMGLDSLAYIQNGSWPTIQEMIDNHKQLVLFVENNNTGQLREPWLMHAWSTIFDTPYTYSSVSEFSSTVNRGGTGTMELYLVNHWLSGTLGLPDSTLAPLANRHDILCQHLHDCQNSNHHLINYVGVDFYHIGDAQVIVDSINGF